MACAEMHLDVGHALVGTVAGISPSSGRDLESAIKLLLLVFPHVSPVRFLLCLLA